ncbi:T9SS type A sorting domain-containing protein [Rhodothermus marinus]|uniref:T9SS type A sorting domain-containing protein n=1 Tax=Rhodothermus marinus TaxID=29549 RepID=UPI0037C6F605
MRRFATILIMLGMGLLPTLPLRAQSAGDYRTRASGNWSQASVWERYTGATWAPATSAPTGSETITVQSADSVYVDVPVTITGRLINQGVVHAEEGMLTIGDGGVYQHDRDAGKIPLATWAEGSTLHLTGVETQAPADRNQPYYNIIFETPNLLSNLNMNLDEVTIGGDIRVLDTGSARWYLTTAAVNDTSEITIMGDVYVEKGAFSVQGTSKAYTTFIVHHYGNIVVTGGNFSISRGSQPGGTTTWYLYEGDFSMENATTQSSTATPGGAKFVFAKQGTQRLTLGEGNDIRALPIEVAEGTTLDMGTSELGGEGIFILNGGATLATAHPGGVAGSIQTLGTVALDTTANFVFNGSEPQETSTLMPTVVNDLVIDNEAGVRLSQPTRIDGVLRLKAGVFDNTIPFTLGPNGSISYEGGSLLQPVANEPIDEVPQRFVLEQNYPNPFHRTTTIRFGLPSSGYVSIKLYDLLGREVMTVLEGHQAAGFHEVTLDAGRLSPGLYWYRLQSAEHVITRQLMLIK